MEEETVVTEPTPEDVPQSPAEAQKPDSEELKIPKSRFDEVLAQKKELEKRVQAADKAKVEAEQKALEEQGQYKLLYEQAKQEADQAATALKQAQIDSIKRNVATEAGYPALWERVRGEDEESIRLDMEQLVSAIPGLKAPSIDGGTGSGDRPGSNNATKVSKSTMDEWASVLGIPAEHMKDVPLFSK